MSPSHRIAIAIVAAMPLAASAEPPENEPHKPDAVVVQPAYRSAFDGYQPLQEMNDSPDKHWREMNEEIAGANQGVAQTKDATSSAKEMPAQPSIPREQHLQHKH